MLFCIQEIKDIKESYQIPAICVVKIRYFLIFFIKEVI